MIGFQKVAYHHGRFDRGRSIVGAATLMRVNTIFRILDYPGLAVVLFLGAAGCGIPLLINILFYDKPDKD